MKFASLFRVRLRHPYYADECCTDFAIEPTRPTQRLLANTRCVLKALPDGIQLLTAVTDAGTPLLPLPPDATLMFHLRLHNPDFVLCTDLRDFTDLRDGRLTVPLYTNASLRPADQGQHLQLQCNRQPVGEPLPHPALQHYSTLPVPGARQRQETLLHIVRHLTNPL